MSGLRYLTEEPPNAGVPIGDLDGRALHQSSVYMRNNFPLPQPIDGEIAVDLGERSFKLLAERLIPTVEIEMVLECAGNGRIHMDPVPDGTPWDLGGVSPVGFGGVPLLDAIGAIPENVECLVFTGADEGTVEPEGNIHYQFSLDRDRWAGAILATEIGQEPLSHAHGGPVRLVVPGDYAMKSVKWLTSIGSMAGEFDGHFVRKYRYFGDTEEPEGSPVSTIRVRSIVASPLGSQVLSHGEFEVSGSAWSGNGTIEKVEVSLDGGPWFSVGIVPGASPTAAVSWRTPKINLPPGVHRVRARATDSSGDTQPVTPRWNRNGYANNLVHEVEFTVV